MRMQRGVPYAQCNDNHKPAKRLYEEYYNGSMAACVSRVTHAAHYYRQRAAHKTISCLYYLRHVFMRPAVRCSSLSSYVREKRLANPGIELVL